MSNQPEASEHGFTELSATKRRRRQEKSPTVDHEAFRSGG